MMHADPQTTTTSVRTATLAMPPIEGPSGWNEMLSPTGAVREHWEYVADALHELGTDALAGRADHARRLLREDGATYNTNGDPGSQSRPWGLDPIPLLIDGDDWTRLESGLIQRAELFDLILADLYGPRRLLERGLLPPRLVYGHAGFLRSCDGIRLPGPRQLVTFAVDLARDARGDFVVLSDRSQAPSGSGYALENRRVLTQVLPSLFRDANVHRLAGYFRSLRATLAEQAPPGDDEPRVVILTPGTLNETYFEQAYLAAYLGYALVEGPDLTVRDGKVWLRSLGGLEQVDVILRRVDDQWCDPLELRADSRLGVAGLIEASRRGTVSVVNPLGSGVLENPGLLPFLPEISEALLGQELRLPSAQSWWCGRPADLDHVVAHLDDLVLKPISRSAGSVPVFGGRLTSDQRDEWIDRLRAEPEAWTAQEQVPLSTAPTLAGETIAPRRLTLRTFLAARGESYAVMPGGLTRVALDAEALVVSNLTGASSKDTWVVGSEPVSQVSLWLESRLSPSDEDVNSVPSRASENLYWVGRYAERAEATIRLARAIVARFDDPDDPVSWSDSTVIDALVGALGRFVDADATGLPVAPATDEESTAVILRMLLDSERSTSLASGVRNLLGAAYSVRDRLSGDTWRVVHDIEQELLVLEPSADEPIVARHALDRLLHSLLALAGLTNESMVRGPGWRFLDTGRRLERALLLISLLRSAFVEPRETMSEARLGESVLAAGESLVAYRRRYRSHLRADTVLELMLADPSNPRSVRYQLDCLGEHVAELPRRATASLVTEERLILDASTRLRLADTRGLTEIDPGTGRREALDDLLLSIVTLLHRTSDELTRRCFTHLQDGPRPVAEAMRSSV